MIHDLLYYKNIFRGIIMVIKRFHRSVKLLFSIFSPSSEAKLLDSALKNEHKDVINCRVASQKQ